MNPLLSAKDQAQQRYLRKTIDILVAARGELLAAPDYDCVAASTLWVMISRFVNEARALAEAGWSKPGTEGWYTRLQNLGKERRTRNEN